MASLEPISGPLGFQRASHLLRRATFGPDRAEIDSASVKTADEMMDILFQPLPHPEPPVDPATGLPWVNPKPGPGNSDENELIAYFAAWHLEQMRTIPTNAREKLVFFLHSHLPVASSKVNVSTALYYQNKLYRQYAFGSYKDLFRKVVYDNAMLIYIDNYLNTAENPNENFAREMFELYTIGKGPQIAPGDYTHYTEQDIKEAARVLTGFFYDETFENYDPEFLPDVQIAQARVYSWGDQQLAVLHDPGTKVFSDKFQNRQITPSEVLFGYATVPAVMGELEDLIDMIFDQEETAKFLCRKLYHFFVYYKIDDEIEQDIIVPLAQTFRESNYNLETVLRRLLKSQHFYDADNSVTQDDHIGALIKSPVDLIQHIFRFFGISFPTDPYKLYQELYKNIALTYMYLMGMHFYEPPDVAGFPAYFQAPGYNRNWITPANLAFRYWLIYPLIIGIENAGGEMLIRLDVVAWVGNPANISDPANPATLIRELTSCSMATNLPEERFQYFLNQVFLEGYPEYYWTNEWNNFLSSGNDGVVRVQLTKLFVAIFQSPEMQLF